MDERETHTGKRRRSEKGRKSLKRERVRACMLGIYVVEKKRTEREKCVSKCVCVCVCVNVDR